MGNLLQGRELLFQWPLLPKATPLSQVYPFSGTGKELPTWKRVPGSENLDLAYFRLIARKGIPGGRPVCPRPLPRQGACPNNADPEEASGLANRDPVRGIGWY